MFSAVVATFKHMHAAAKRAGHKRVCLEPVETMG
jgi:hypothetical protein